MATVPVWTPEQVAERIGRSRCPVVWASGGVSAKVADRFHLAPQPADIPLPSACDLLVAIGGGKLIDRAKWMCKAPALSGAAATPLIAIPSLWGSGAEASRVVVLDDHGRKTIHVDDRLLPDARAIWPELAETVPPALARDACGDTWSHALEGFASPLASDSLRAELASLMRTMLALPLDTDARWFEPSARACAGQAASSVGLIHGIAHTLEAPLIAAHPGAGWGHARLCATFLWPVLRFNLESSDKVRTIANAHGLDFDAIARVARNLFNPAAFSQALPLLTEHWRSVLRDPCTRTNPVLVRPASLEFFQQEAFA